MLATVLAFIFSTSVNWFLGKMWTFKGNMKYQGKVLQEVALIFVASAVGLGFNLILMRVFVDFLKMDTSLLSTLAKVISTGMVFIWNYMIRRFVIYRTT